MYDTCKSQEIGPAHGSRTLCVEGCEGFENEGAAGGVYHVHRTQRNEEERRGEQKLLFMISRCVLVVFYSFYFLPIATGLITILFCSFLCILLSIMSHHVCIMAPSIPYFTPAILSFSLSYHLFHLSLLLGMAGRVRGKAVKNITLKERDPADESAVQGEREGGGREEKRDSRSQSSTPTRRGSLLVMSHHHSSQSFLTVIPHNHSSSSFHCFIKHSNGAMWNRNNDDR